ncbi:roadblock/LC7 domain-containing protein [bacterium]|nr:MAG: roadblock/LC7 domain-containing protein [bacterium]RKZ26111.1 MAG: roadblock/LC7 domain-containing protein [bacterium]
MPDELNIFEEEFWSIKGVLEKLLQGANAKAVLLIDKAGQLITSAGDTTGIDVPSFSTLAAADFAATSQLATLIGESEFSHLFHQGEKNSIYVTLVASKVILAVIFDNRTNLGLVRVRVKQAASELEAIFKRIYEKLESELGSPLKLDEGFIEEAESELDNLFK